MSNVSHAVEFQIFTLCLCNPLILCWCKIKLLNKSQITDFHGPKYQIIFTKTARKSSYFAHGKDYDRKWLAFGFLFDGKVMLQIFIVNSEIFAMFLLLRKM